MFSRVNVSSVLKGQRARSASICLVLYMGANVPLEVAFVIKQFLTNLTETLN